MKRILVPTDFSDNARNALNVAVDVANHFGSEITLVHTFRVYSTTGMFISVESYMEEDARREMTELVGAFQPRLKNKASLRHRIIRGDAGPLIADMADKSGFDLIVMGTQGASGLKEIFTGSVTNSVIKHTRTPVLVIPVGFVYRPVRIIVLAVDQDSISGPAVTAPLVRLARGYGAKVRIFHQDTGIGDTGIDPTVDIFLENIEHSFHYELDEGHISQSINDFIQDSRADLLCMIRRERSFLEKIFHVSATTKEVFHCSIPLLVLRDAG